MCSNGISVLENQKQIKINKKKKKKNNNKKNNNNNNKINK